jgi:lipopolysaccharide transport system permease protein
MTQNAILPADEKRPPSSRAVVRIKASKGWAALDLKALWDYRELMFFLAWRDIKVRYKQTYLGAAWAVLVPVLTMLVFNVLFGLIMGNGNKPSPAGVPYELSTFAAMVPWQLFANAITQSSTSLVTNRNMITKVYFPRLIAPIAPILAALVDFAIAFGVLAAMVTVYALIGAFEFELSWRLLALPLFVLLAALTALALSMWLSAANAIYRDVKYILPFLVQTLMFISPVVYSVDSIFDANTPAWLVSLYCLNPLVFVLEGFRWALFGAGMVTVPMMVTSAIGVFVLFVGGAFYFRRMERLFADVA